MKRDRENDDEDDDIERTLLGPNRTFSISPDSNSSNTTNHNTTSTNTNNQNVTISTTNTLPSNNENPPSASIGATSNTSNNNIISSNGGNKEQDRFLPIANVGRIMKKVIPGNAKISKDAKETVQECVSEFISFVTGEASDKCQREKRKTINGDDILWAIMTLGFEDYVNPLKLYLTKYRDIEGEKLNVPKQQQQQQQRLHLEQKPDMAYGNVYSSTSLIHQPSFASSDSSFPLPFSQSSMHRPPQDNIDEHW